MRKLLLALSILFTIICPTLAQDVQNNLQKELTALYSKSELSGFAVAIVNSEKVLFKNSFGFENLASQTDFSTNKRYSVASISKTFLGLSLMKLVESGQLELSTPINSILPFEVVNPNHPSVEITVEHLARHSSSLLYGELERKSWYVEDDINLNKKEIGKTAFRDFSAWSKNSKSELGSFLKACLTPSGSHYSKSNFSKNKPGETYEYSNLGAALAGYIVELKTGMPYREYVEQMVERDIGLKPGNWRSTMTQAMPTSYFQKKVETPLHFPLIYPAGGLMLSCDDLSNYLMAMIQGFEGNSQILKPESFQFMMTPSNKSNPKGGIFWELNGDKIGHNGGNYGVTCFMSFNKNTGIGKLFMANISSYKDDSLLKKMIGIWRKLGEYESKLN